MIVIAELKDYMQTLMAKNNLWGGEKNEVNIFKEIEKGA